MKEILIHLRTENRYSQNSLAKELGISRQAYIKYETGEVEPSVEIVRKLSKLFNVSYETLIDNEIKNSFLEKNAEYVISESERLMVESPAPAYGYSKPNNTTVIRQQIQKNLCTLSQDQLSSVLTIIQSIGQLNYSSSACSAGTTKKRTPGGLQGNLWMSEDFDAPLGEFKEYM